jgi:hypothetical protein
VRGHGALRWASLELSWLCALELLRERAPGALRVVLAGPWTLAAAAWLHPEPADRRWREALRLVGCSLVFEATLDGMLSCNATPA